MWLAVDIGNTNTVLGCYTDDQQLRHHWRISSDQNRTVDEQTLMIRQLCDASSLKPQQIHHVVIGSVVPALTQTCSQALRILCGIDPIVVDFGTATTFDVISGEGEYLGGVIAPGVRTSASDLFARAAKLPRFVEIREPSAVIGRTTEESILSGLFFGTIGQVDEVVSRIEQQLDGHSTVVATGGLAHLIAPRSETIQEICPHLTLEGLILIGKRTAGLK
jgi:type III pantothenate kinase